MLIFLRNQIHPSKIRIFCDSDAWHSIISEVFKERLKVVPMFHFSFNLQATTFISGWKNRMPSGYTVKKIDAPLLHRLLTTYNELVIPSWEPSDFLKYGVGLCLLTGEDEVVSICTSVSIGNRLVTIGIDTNDRFQRRGFGTLICSAFIEYCLTHDLIPVWECDSSNIASHALARKCNSKFFRAEFDHVFVLSAHYQVFYNQGKIMGPPSFKANAV